MSSIAATQVAAVQTAEAQAAPMNLQAWANLDAATWQATQTRAQAMNALNNSNAQTVSAIQSTYIAAVRAAGQVSVLTFQARLPYYQTYLSATQTLIGGNQGDLQAQATMQQAQGILSVAQSINNQVQGLLSQANANLLAAQNYLAAAQTNYANSSLLDKPAAWAVVLYAQVRVVICQVAVTLANVAAGVAQTALNAAQSYCDTVTNEYTTEHAGFIVATRTYQLTVDQADVDFAQTNSNIVVANAQAMIAAQLAKSTALLAAQQQLVVQSDVIMATFISATSQAVANYGLAESAASSVLQMGLLMSTGVQGVATAEAQGAYQADQAAVASTQTAAALLAMYTWKETEKDALETLAITQADADETQGLANINAVLTQQQTLNVVQSTWTTATNAASQQLTADSTMAGNAYATALGFAQNNWQTAIVMAQSTLVASATVMQNAYKMAVSQNTAAWQTAVVSAQANDILAEAAAADSLVSTETPNWKVLLTNTAAWQNSVTNWWNFHQHTGWSKYQVALASAWQAYISQTATTETGLRKSDADTATSFVGSYVQAWQTSSQQLTAAMVTGTTSANGVFTNFIALTNVAQNDLTIGQNQVQQAYITTTNPAYLTQANSTTQADAALATSFATANSIWTGAETTAANSQQTTLTVAYNDLVVAQAVATRAFFAAEADAAQTRDSVQNTARLTHDQIVASLHAEQQDSQWSAMEVYAPLQTQAAANWANAVKQASAYLKQGLNAATSQMLEAAAAIIAHYQPLTYVVGQNAFIAQTMLAQTSAINQSQQKYKSDFNQPLNYFVNITPKPPAAVQRAMAAEANSQGPTDIWGRIESGLNTLTGGQSRAILLSPGFTRALNAIDGFFAGVADSLTAGLSTKARAAMYGETATQNHTGGWFALGQGVGAVLSIPLMAANPCSMGAVFGAGLRVLNGIQLVGNGINAVQNIMAGNYLSAGMDILGMLGNLSKLSAACFTAETEIWTSRGFVRFDALATDDKVASCAEHDPHGPIEFKRIEIIFQNYLPIWHIHAAGKVIRTTEGHPFFVWSKGWVPTKSLQPGDRFRADDGRTVTVEEVLNTEIKELVYNCSVADYHTYFIGADSWGFGIWAHNMKCSGPAVPTSTIGGRYQSYVAKVISGIKQKYETIVEVVLKTGTTVKARIDTLTRWWVVEAKYSPWNVAKGFYSKIKIGSQRHVEMVDQMKRLLTIAEETGKKGVLVVSTTFKSLANLRRLYKADSVLAQAIKDNKIVFRKINWWNR